jgi:hypothetical protein
MEELERAALECADMGGFGVLPSPYRRAFVDALQAVLDAGANLAAVSLRLAELRPEDFLVLGEPVRGFLTSTDVLGISEEDLPVDAMEYLSLVVFLRGEMDEGNLPYRDFAELTRAAEHGRTLAQGLCDEDRERLVRMRIEPLLRRLWPRDPEHVEAEVERLLG